MKLLTKTSLNFFSAAAFMFLGGSFVFYYIIRTTINSNLNDELLTLKKQYLSEINVHHGSQTGLEFNEIKSIITPYSESKIINDLYSDTILFNKTESKYYLYRQLKFTLDIQGKVYLFQLFKPQKNSDNLIADLAITMAIAAILFMISLYLLNRHTLKKSWAPFYKTIDKIKDFDINTAGELTFEEAEIVEFQQLNKVLDNMTKQINQDFENLKEYTENTSHEIQTPLAIINSKAELLLQSDNLTEQQLQEVSSIYEATDRLSKLTQSLIYLAKLDKRQFVEMSDVDLGKLINRNIKLFNDYLKMKNISVKKDIENNIVLKINPELADTLIQNIIKNAIRHNIEDGYINIILNKESFKIINPGNYNTENTEDFFNRFKKLNPYSKSPGIGLSIVKRICEIFSLKIEYKSADKIHTITVYL